MTMLKINLSYFYWHSQISLRDGSDTDGGAKQNHHPHSWSYLITPFQCIKLMQGACVPLAR